MLDAAGRTNRGYGRSNRPWTRHYGQSRGFKEGGWRQYEAYGEAARPLANRYGARVRYLGEVAVTVIGNDKWDLVALVD